MKKTIIFYFLFTISLLFFFQNSLFAAFRTGLPHDPNWLVDEEISAYCEGWNKGHILCKPPRGGYNEITENQKILNSWGYKARPMEEIKDLLPEPQYNMYADPDAWGTMRINETAWEPVKPRGAMWEKFMAQTKKNKKEVYLDDKKWLRNYKYGMPFPDLDENDPKIAVKLIWNYFKRYQDNDRTVNMDITTKDRRGNERHNLLTNRRLQLNGRTKNDEHTVDGVYRPNPKNYEFIYTSPYVAPYNLRGTIAMYYRYNDPDKDDTMWVYIPSIRRIRRLSTAQHQDRVPGGLDWTWDNTECFEGNVTRFDFTYMGRKEMLVAVVAHSHTYWDPTSWMNCNDQYYQRRNCYVVKAKYKNPINMTEMILYFDPLLYTCPWSVDRDMKGRDWIIQIVTQGRDKHWFYAMYNDYAIDILRKHASRAQFSFSGSEDYTIEDLSMESMKREFLSR